MGENKSDEVKGKIAISHELEDEKNSEKILHQQAIVYLFAVCVVFIGFV